MTAKYDIRVMSRQEFDIAVGWAETEGWKPGIDDAECFYQTDPGGFLMGFLDGDPIASISAVKYSGGIGFIGFYIVKPEYRGRGYGYRLWQAAMTSLQGYNVGLDGVPAQQDNYRKSGFTLLWRNTRYGGPGGGEVPQNPDLIPASDVPMAMLESFDRKFFPAPRPAFLPLWISRPHNRALALMPGSEITGYGVIRECRSGCRIGPLFADNAAAAETLFIALKAQVSADTSVFLDVPECNPAAVAMAKRHRMSPSFETARMYTGPLPDMDLTGIFGISSLELG